MKKKQLEAVFAWFREHNVGQHVTFGSMLAFILSVTGLATSGDVGFLILNILSGLWLIVRLYLAEFLPVTVKNSEGLLTAVLTPDELRTMIQELRTPAMLNPEPEKESA